jgi:hypothetical protein
MELPGSPFLNDSSASIESGLSAHVRVGVLGVGQLVSGRCVAVILVRPFLDENIGACARVGLRPLSS